MLPAIAIDRFIAANHTALASGIHPEDHLCSKPALITETSLTNDTPKVLISEAEIADRVAALAAGISAQYDECDNLVLVGVLKGSFIFLADLSRQLTVPHVVEFIAVSSYPDGSQSSGAVRLVMDVRGSIVGKDVLIVEDIVDTGHTLKYLIGMLESHGPESVRTCALVRKADRAEVDVPVDYLGFDIPDEWVVGYGLDYAEQNRTLPYIGVIPPDDQK
jgi:hypoxanthine phosphoribosyltransferase